MTRAADLAARRLPAPLRPATRPLALSAVRALGFVLLAWGFIGPAQAALDLAERAQVVEGVDGDPVLLDDSQGNLTSIDELDPRSGESNQITMTYDQSKHPYNALSYYFEGMSYVNNMLSRSDEESGMDYLYDLRLNEYEYPETVYEKLGSTYSRITSYSYLIN